MHDVLDAELVGQRQALLRTIGALAATGRRSRHDSPRARTRGGDPARDRARGWDASCSAAGLLHLSTCRQERAGPDLLIAAAAAIAGPRHGAPPSRLVRLIGLRHVTSSFSAGELYEDDGPSALSPRELEGAPEVRLRRSHVECIARSPARSRNRPSAASSCESRRLPPPSRARAPARSGERGSPRGRRAVPQRPPRSTPPR